MVIFIKKIKTKEGINSFNMDKIRKEVPSEYEILAGDPIISFTANHIVIAIKCSLKVVAKKEPATKKVAVKKKVTDAKA